MIDIRKILFVVQARLGSQRVPQKMIRPFGHTTLSDIILEKVVLSDIPPKNFYFSVYEPELKEIGHKWGVNIFHRSEQSAKSEGTPLTEIYEWYTLPYEYVILISGCNPLLSVKTINAFIKEFRTGHHDGLFGVIPKRTYYWNAQGDCIVPFTQNERIMNTKTVEVMYEAAHCLYASRMDLIPQGYWMGDFTAGHPSLFIVPELEAFDIDVQWQFDVAEQLYLKDGWKIKK